MTPSAAQATAVGFLGAGVVGTITSGAAALAATAGLAFNAAAHFSTIYIVREAAPIVQALLLMVLAVLLALAGLWDVHDVIGLCLEASSDLQLRPSHSRQTSMQSCGNGEVTPPLPRAAIAVYVFAAATSLGFTSRSTLFAFAISATRRS
jgi:hypothetical protein